MTIKLKVVAEFSFGRVVFTWTIAGKYQRSAYQNIKDAIAYIKAVSCDPPLAVNCQSKLNHESLSY